MGEEITPDELLEDPPVYTVLATFFAPLDHLLDGESEFSEVFMMDWPVDPPASPASDVEVNTF